MSGSTDTASDRGDSNQSPYFDSVSAEVEDIEARQGKLEQQKEALKQLDNLVSEIDCNVGGASLEINEKGVVHVTTSSPTLCEEVRQLVHGYDWPQEFKIGYETRSRCITWSLKTDLETLTDSHQSQITG